MDMQEMNPTPTGEGFTLYKHWERTARGNLYLLSVSSTPVHMVLEPGDIIISRTWAPAGLASSYNKALDPGGSK